MKYAIVIPDGAADEPQPDLDGRTPLQAAQMPNADRAVMIGQLALTNNVPPTLTPASDVAMLSLFGYDPLVCYTGRAPLEAAALGVTLGSNDWAIRCNLVHVEDGRMTDFTAGHIPRDESRRLIETLQATLGSKQLQFVSGVSYRNLLVDRSSARCTAETKTQAPHDIPNEPITDHLPTGPGSDFLRDLMERAAHILAAHPVNLARTYAGKRTANRIWLWGQGRSPQIERFADRYGKSGAITSAVDLVRGVGVLLGWDRLDHQVVTDYLDNDYAKQAELALTGLKTHDLVCIHVEAPDEASHEGQARQEDRIARADRRRHYRAAARRAAELRRLAALDRPRSSHSRAHAGARAWAVRRLSAEPASRPAGNPRTMKLPPPLQD